MTRRTRKPRSPWVTLDPATTSRATFDRGIRAGGQIFIEVGELVRALRLDPERMRQFLASGEITAYVGDGGRPVLDARDVVTLMATHGLAFPPRMH